MHYVRKLGFEEQPDYDFLRELFSKVLKNIGEVEDGVFDWMLLNGGKGFEAGQVSIRAQRVMFLLSQFRVASSGVFAHSAPRTPSPRPGTCSPPLASTTRAATTAATGVTHGACAITCCCQDQQTSGAARVTRTHQRAARCTHQPTGKPAPHGPRAREHAGCAAPVRDCVKPESVSQYCVRQHFAGAVQWNGPVEQRPR